MAGLALPRRFAELCGEPNDTGENGGAWMSFLGIRCRADCRAEDAGSNGTDHLFFLSLYSMAILDIFCILLSFILPDDYYTSIR